MAGAGRQKAGSTPAGIGTSEEATPLGGAFLRDTKTGASFGVRQVDPEKRDYVMDEHGRTLGMNYVQHVVQMSVHTERGSAAVREMGQRLRTIDRVTPNFETQILAILTEAVQPLIDLGYVEVLGFSHFVAGNDRNGLRRGATYGRFRWKDLTTGEEHKEIV